MITFLWENTYKLLKHELLRRDINDCLLPIVWIEFIQKFRNKDYDNIFKEWDKKTTNTQKYFNQTVKDHLLKIASCIPERLYTKKCSVLSSYEQGEYLKECYITLSKYKCLDIVLNKCNYTHFYSFIEIINFLVTNNLLSKIVIEVSTAINNMDESYAINYLYDLYSYNRKKYNHWLIIRKWDDYQNSFVFGISKHSSNKPEELHYFPNFSCLWNFSEGFARFLTKEGVWGFIREDDCEIFYLPKSIVRLHDFHCGRAKFESETTRNSLFKTPFLFGFLDTKMKEIIKPTFITATDFKHNTAQVRSELAIGGVSINPQGYPITKDRYRKIYEKELIRDFEKEITTEETSVSTKRICNDDESTVMRALRNGDGDAWGF